MQKAGPPRAPVTGRGEGERQLRRLGFDCRECGSPTDAPSETKRAERELCRRCFGKGKDRRPKELNHLTGKEWARASKSVETYPDTRTGVQRRHGAAFPQSLAEQHIRIYTKKGQTVLDPFVGVGTTVFAAAKLERFGIGIDINPDFLSLAEQVSQYSDRLRLICDDARNMEKHIKQNSVDFILTSPPYGNLLQTVKGAFAYKWREHSKLNPISNPAPYSSDKRDLGNMELGEFVDALAEMMRASLRILKSGSYAAWVVKDYRMVKRGVPYVNLHGEVVRCGEQAGLTLWDIRIFDQTRYRPLVCLGYPSKKFYLNIGHSYILIFRKP